MAVLFLLLGGAGGAVELSEPQQQAHDLAQEVEAAGPLPETARA
jgi:hypothetical protein